MFSFLREIGVTGTLNKVVENGYCIGCGACAVERRFGIQMQKTADGRYCAHMGASAPDEAAALCPFASKLNEDMLSELFFGAHEGQYRHSALGTYLACFAGHVETDAYRSEGSSGGFVSWLACLLLERGLVDAVIHVTPSHSDHGGPPLFSYSISDNAEQVRLGAKSRYYPIELSEVLLRVRSDRRRYLFIGLPCFVKAVRLLQLADEDLKHRIPFMIGLVCGHLKTMQFADFYARSLHIDPHDVASINFRHKLPDNPVNDYGVEITKLDGTKCVGENRLIFGTSWGYGFFKNEACDYCDDVLSETADLTVGDAWLPAYEKDWRGTNILVVRNPILLQILREGIDNGPLVLDPVSADDVARSQASGLKHRRQGLAYRLWLKDSKKSWRPAKRVKASDGCDFGWRFRATQKARIALARCSREFFKSVSGPWTFALFCARMRVLVFLHDLFNRGLVSAGAAIIPAVYKRHLKMLFKRIQPSK